MRYKLLSLSAGLLFAISINSCKQGSNLTDNNVPMSMSSALMLPSSVSVTPLQVGTSVFGETIWGNKTLAAFSISTRKLGNRTEITATITNVGEWYVEASAYYSDGSRAASLGLMAPGASSQITLIFSGTVTSAYLRASTANSYAVRLYNALDGLWVLTTDRHVPARKLSDAISSVASLAGSLAVDKMLGYVTQSPSKVVDALKPILTQSGARTLPISASIVQFLGRGAEIAFSVVDLLNVPGRLWLEAQNNGLRNDKSILKIQLQ